VAVYLAARWRDTRTYRQLYRRELDPGLHEHAVIIIIIMKTAEYTVKRGIHGDGAKGGAIGDNLVAGVIVVTNNP
jgi:hypothetical protein